MGGYFTKGSNWLQLRPPRIVYRIPYVVYREKMSSPLRGEGRGEGERKNKGFEAESSAFGGWKMSEANGSEGNILNTS